MVTGSFPSLKSDGLIEATSRADIGASRSEFPSLKSDGLIEAPGGQHGRVATQADLKVRLYGSIQITVRLKPDTTYEDASTYENARRVRR